ncbi:MAG: ACP S-malonyltransferase [Chloroflexi bacterium]|nr:ACP S-malonyltransferase [Chloroflexota bacterium]
MGNDAWLFPGQGSQKVGMGCDLFEHDAATRALFQEAADIAQKDIAALCFEGPPEVLQQTQHAQPCLLAVSVAFARYLQQHGNNPAVVAGHSLGEYSALVTAGVLTFADAMRIVLRRGELMAAATAGAMAAIIGPTAEEVVHMCTDTQDLVWPANFNTPQQTVISGTVDAVAQAIQRAREQLNARVIPLRVSGAFHSPLMQDTAAGLLPLLATVPWGDPKIPIISTVDAKVYTHSGEFRELLQRQVVAPVQWTATAARIAALLPDRCLEVGPGTVLIGLMRQSHASCPLLPCGTLEECRQLI